MQDEIVTTQHPQQLYPGMSGLLFDGNGKMTIVVKVTQPGRTRPKHELFLEAMARKAEEDPKFMDTMIELFGKGELWRLR